MNRQKIDPELLAVIVQTEADLIRQITESECVIVRIGEMEYAAIFTIFAIKELSNQS